MPPSTPTTPAASRSWLWPAWPWFCLAVALGCSLHFSRLGWNLPLLDHWGFRESQTAITAQVFLRDGVRFDYETPILGAPWSIPFEFPTYQLAVVAVVKLTGWPLDQTGRLVSLVFAYAAFALLAVFVSRATGSRSAGIFSASFALVSPVYLYGSRAFMIESTALALTLALLVATQEFLLHPRRRILPWILLCGLLAGPTKSTTYAVGLIGVVGLLISHGPALWAKRHALPAFARLATGFLAALALPFLATLAWTRHTDALKQQNELAHFITSSALKDWNFGTWAQRLDSKTWDQIFRFVDQSVLGSPAAWIIGVALVSFVGRPRRVMIVLLALFSTGFLVFTNLYAVHEYYHYATGVYLLALFGVAVGRLWDRESPPLRLFAGVVGAPALAGLMLWGYVDRSLPRQLETDANLLALAAAIREHAPADSVILVYGQDWASGLPYYAQRRALMNRLALPGTDPVLRRALDRLDHPLAAIVFCYPFKDDHDFVYPQLTALGCGHRAAYSGPSGDVYLMNDLTSAETAIWRDAGFDDAPRKIDNAVPTQSFIFHGRPAMLVHAPGAVTVERRAGSRTLTFSFGVRPEAYSGANRTDGVTFAVDYLDSARRQVRLFERQMDPARVAADQGPQTVTLLLPDDGAGEFVFRTEPGVSNAFDWSMWRDVRQQ